MRKFLVLALCLWLSSGRLHAQEACSRVAVINGQEVLVDTSSSKRGEGLRFYLEKDEAAKNYLDKYQKGPMPLWASASIGTLGTGLVLLGVFTPKGNDGEKSMKNIYLAGGVTLLAMNFLVYKTLEQQSEFLLERAVQEYNLRNLPKIFFSPLVPSSSSGRTRSGLREMLGISTGFSTDF